MESAPRYEIVDTIATGDFAVVYRARDRELGREVAVKQIHRQFLTDERQLARYWQEAQLLASLQHPNILTIYDIVRSKGWLIVELMRGSLQPATQSEGIDLDFLRIALTNCLSALQFLHANGVIHGDIKPSNMLVDSQGRVKLGDFGLARRASNEGGSLLKGTTKYMAPELLSPQMGAVGPASDLYSLGFSAYELMCGKEFETLFPGLGTFGRDKQIAWMMWHAAADRNMPPIDRVLEGVPDDLARVIQRLVVKDQSQRYRSAKDALWDLRVNPLAGLPRPEDVEAAAEAAKAVAAKRKRRKRFAAILSVACSLVLSVALYVWLSQPRPAPPRPQSIAGVVANIYPKEWTVEIVSASDGNPKDVKCDSQTPIFVNDERCLLRDLRPHDQFVAKLDNPGRKVKEIRAIRPDIASGLVKEVKAADNQFTFAADVGEGKSKDLVITVPQDLKIRFNGQIELAGRPVSIADLQPGDRVVVHHRGTQTGREATELSAERVVDLAGKIGEVKIDEAKNEQKLTINVGTDEKPQLIEFPFAPECEITINGRRLINDQVLKPADLKPGDKATLAHDTRVVKVTAQRVIHDTGVVGKVQADAVDVTRKGEDKPTRYGIGEKCAIKLNGEPAKLVDLRDGDMLEITHESIDGKNPEAVSVDVQRPLDRTRWAILIGVQAYENRALSRPAYAVADARLLQDALVGRYQVPAEQVLMLTDESRARLEQSIPEYLGRIAPEGKLLVFFSGHAYKDSDGKVYLALKDFDPGRISDTGLALQWLVDELEKCPAKEKLLLLDAGRAGTGADQALEPSAEEMIGSLKAPPGRVPLRTVTAIASCKAGQHSLDWPEKQHGLFAWLVAQGYSGAADKNRDNRVESTELFGYLQDAMSAAGEQLKASQAPAMCLGDDRPFRLTEEAKVAIRKLASHVRQERLRAAEAKADYDAAAQAAGKEPEPRLLYGLLLLKSKQRDVSAKYFEDMAAQYPNALVPLEAVAWLRFERRAYQSGLEELTELASKVPKPKKPNEPHRESDLQLFTWIGQLREFAAVAAEEGKRPPTDALATLDAAVAKHGPDAVRAYEEGRAKSQEVRDDFEKRIADAGSTADAKSLNIQRRNVVQFVRFPEDQLVQQILAGLDQ